MPHPTETMRSTMWSRSCSRTGPLTTSSAASTSPGRSPRFEACSAGDLSNPLPAWAEHGAGCEPGPHRPSLRAYLGLPDFSSS